MTPEGSLMRTVQELLTVERVRFHRLNSGVMLLPGKSGKKRAVRLAAPGTADIVALVECGREGLRRPVYIELKAPNGHQSAAQRQFQRDVEAEGCEYLLVRDVSQLVEYLREIR